MASCLDTMIGHDLFNNGRRTFLKVETIASAKTDVFYCGPLCPFLYSHYLARALKPNETYLNQWKPQNDTSVKVSGLCCRWS